MAFLSVQGQAFVNVCACCWLQMLWTYPQKRELSHCIKMCNAWFVWSQKAGSRDGFFQPCGKVSWTLLPNLNCKSPYLHVVHLAIQIVSSVSLTLFNLQMLSHLPDLPMFVSPLRFRFLSTALAWKQRGGNLWTKGEVPARKWSKMRRAREMLACLTVRPIVVLRGENWSQCPGGKCESRNHHTS